MISVNELQYLNWPYLPLKCVGSNFVSTGCLQYGFPDMASRSNVTRRPRDVARDNACRLIMDEVRHQFTARARKKSHASFGCEIPKTQSQLLNYSQLQCDEKLVRRSNLSANDATRSHCLLKSSSLWPTWSTSAW